jgi:hypothetical protein
MCLPGRRSAARRVARRGGGRSTKPRRSGCSQGGRGRREGREGSGISGASLAKKGRVRYCLALMEACSPPWGGGREARPARRPRLVREDPHPTGPRPRSRGDPPRPAPAEAASPVRAVGASPAGGAPGPWQGGGSDGHLAPTRQGARQGARRGGQGGCSARPGRRHRRRARPAQGSRAIALLLNTFRLVQSHGQVWFDP